MPPTIIQRIDDALSTIPEITQDLGKYAELNDAYDDYVRSGQGFDDLREDLVSLVAAQYRRALAQKVQLLTFSDSSFQFLYDFDRKRNVLVHGFSKTVPKKSRDEPYHKGYPGMKGFDKGHTMSHAQGGLEGGPNYFMQNPKVNRRLSPMGNLWRDIETFLASNAGVFSFVRFLYKRSNDGDIPNKVEYGILNGRSQFRAVTFPNL